MNEIVEQAQRALANELEKLRCENERLREENRSLKLVHRGEVSVYSSALEPLKAIGRQDAGVIHALRGPGSKEID